MYRFLPNQIKNLSDRLFVAGCLAVSGILQLALINRASIWHDEGYSAWLASDSLINILVRTARDVHPPLYYLALHLWSQLFGNSEAALRSMSVVAILGCLVVGFLLLKHLFGSAAARSGLLIISIAPFLVRYGIEARMYALVAILLLGATYMLVTALDTNNPRRLAFYALLMALGFYTHYYTVLLVIVHWLYVMLRTKALTNRVIPVLQNARLKFLPNANWWLANAGIVLFFAPWLPAAYQQFSRVQGGFWIPEVTITTLPSTVGQYLLYRDLSALPLSVRIAIPVLILGLTLVTIWRDKLQRHGISLLALYATIPPLLIFVASLISRPVYVDRYFVFSSLAFYMLLVVILYARPLSFLCKFRPLIMTALICLMIVGVGNMAQRLDHQMRKVAQGVNVAYREGDAIIAGELYVLLDYQYYNHTGYLPKLYAPGGISGYGETSLFYEQATEITTTDMASVPTETGIVWLIGKPGEKDYYQAVPATWLLAGSIEAGDSVARRYVTQ